MVPGAILNLAHPGCARGENIFYMQMIYTHSGRRSERPQGFSDVEGNATTQTIQMIYKRAIIGPVIIIDSPSSRLKENACKLFWGCVNAGRKTQMFFPHWKKKAKQASASYRSSGRGGDENNASVQQQNLTVVSSGTSRQIRHLLPRDASRRCYISGEQEKEAAGRKQKSSFRIRIHEKGK